LETLVFGEPNFQILPKPSYLLFFSITFLVRTAQHLKRFEQRGSQTAILPSRVFDQPSKQAALLFCRLLHELLVCLAGEAYHVDGLFHME
jgi:hypothetical protein